MNYLDFENEKYQKGFEPFKITKESVKANKGKRICYLLRRDYCRHRGTYIVRYARIFDKKYSQLIINENSDSIDIRDIMEIGIEISLTPIT